MQELYVQRRETMRGWLGCGGGDEVGEGARKNTYVDRIEKTVQ
jgi:hypothetical protein